MNPLVPDALVEAVEGGLPASLGAVAVVTLILLLGLRELCNATERPKARILADHIAVIAVPLFVMFVLLVVWKGLEV